MSPRSNQKPSFGQRSTLEKHVTSMCCRLEPAIWSHDTGQQIPYFDRCQLIITWMSDIKQVRRKSRLHVSVNLLLYWSVAAMLRDSSAVAVVVVVRTRPRAIPLAMVHMRKEMISLPFPNMGMGLREGRRSSATTSVASLKFRKYLYR